MVQRFLALLGTSQKSGKLLNDRHPCLLESCCKRRTKRYLGEGQKYESHLDLKCSVKNRSIVVEKIKVSRPTQTRRSQELKASLM